MRETCWSRNSHRRTARRPEEIEARSWAHRWRRSDSAARAAVRVARAARARVRLGHATACACARAESETARRRTISAQARKEEAAVTPQEATRHLALSTAGAATESYVCRARLAAWRARPRPALANPRPAAAALCSRTSKAATARGIRASLTAPGALSASEPPTAPAPARFQASSVRTPTPTIKLPPARLNPGTLTSLVCTAPSGNKSNSSKAGALFPSGSPPSGGRAKPPDRPSVPPGTGSDPCSEPWASALIEASTWPTLARGTGGGTICGASAAAPAIPRPAVSPAAFLSSSAVSSAALLPTPA
eukprot:scaffold16499_cov121-Isochrysis_galbana.AAC.11